MTVKVLVMRVGTRACAIPLEHAVETMRPLPVEPIAGAPSFVAGVAIVRGAPTPVVDLGAMLGARGDVGRFVTVRVAERTVVLAVGAVVGVRDLDPDRMGAAPPLLGAALAGLVDALGALDRELLLVLHAGRLLPEDAWAALPG